jgi:predicted DNA-binding transcriptional regulator YafY
MAFERLLGMGPHVEVLAPEELRGSITEAVGALGALYG